MTSGSLKRMIREELSRRSLPKGGITDLPGQEFRTDATAWGILAFGAAGEDSENLERHRGRLVQEQDKAGRLCIDQQHPDSYWPTALAILAWQSSASSHEAQNRAIRFLIDTTGLHRPRQWFDAAGHDPLLKGWPWIDGTHSWIEPTALNVLSLKATGHAQHERVLEAIRMILDRQLPHGGWNYGSTYVFGKEHLPMPESTGAALAGLAGMVGQEKVARSLAYLQGETDRLRTPISLGWTLLGLAAWELWPSNGLALVERCLANQSRYGVYDTSALCLLLVGALAGEKGNNVDLLTNSGGRPPALGIS
jgi:hypothetical protein